MPIHPALRPSDLLRRHAAPLSVLAVALVLLGGAWTASDLAGTTEERTVLRDAWVERGGFAYHVPVVKDTTTFANGTVLGMGQPGYFTTISPRVDVRFDWHAPKASATGATLVGVARWESREPPASLSFTKPLASAGAGALGQAGALGLTGTLDLDAWHLEVEEALAQLGLSGGQLHWSVVATVEWASATSQGNSTFVLPIRYHRPVYVLPGADALVHRVDHGTPERVVVQRGGGLAGLAARPLGAVAFAGGAALLMLAVAAQRSDPARLPGPEGAYHRERARHAAWITVTSRSLWPSDDADVVDVATVGDLVDLAAEARTRVLLDESSRVFFVVASGLLFRCATHAEAASAPTAELVLLPLEDEEAATPRA